ncbi:MAG TPA: tripartite tricarboxylate transporter substrate binding protein [Pseudolabrys sp.]|nr:tripartite tricarboxylate transporter substrate binding protein [Pseudolabrys sp.]
MSRGQIVKLQFVVLLAVALTGMPQVARADDYPSRAVNLIVPFPPGGSTTVMARNVADKLSAALGQQIVVENRGGAGGTLGTRFVAKAPPDGYTILLSYTATMAIAPAMNANAGYDPHKDFTPIGMIGFAPNVLVVHPSMPVHSIAELIAYAKAAPAPLQYGSPGVGTVNHLAGEYLASEAGLKLQHVPYKGNGPAISDLLGGHIPMMFLPIPVALGNVKAGTLRALAITTAKRSSLLPDLPTLAESGVPGFDAALRYGLMAPAGTPPAVIARLNRELNAALASEDVKERLATEGAESLPGTPEAYAADVAGDEMKWGGLVKKLGLKVE